MDFVSPPPRNYKDYTHKARHQAAQPEAVQAEAPARPKRRRQIASTKVWKKALYIVVVLAVAGLVYGYIHTKNQLEVAKNSPSAAGQSASQQLISKVGKLVDLPAGETPKIFDVNDASKLKNQAFFKDAQNGDRVLFYDKSGLALLYRPSTNKVIRYQPASLGGASTGQ